MNAVYETHEIMRYEILCSKTFGVYETHEIHTAAT